MSAVAISRRAGPVEVDLPRRGFLRQLAALPLIGGGISLIGRPTGVAEPTTPELLEAYKTWLAYERRWLAWEMAGDPVHQARYDNFADAGDRVALSQNIRNCLLFVGDSGSYHGYRRPDPSTRAALVLSTVGCNWREA